MSPSECSQYAAPAQQVETHAWRGESIDRYRGNFRLGRRSMPGIFGAWETDRRSRDRLEAEWRAVWPSVQVHHGSAGIVGSHDRSGGLSSLLLSDGTRLVADGDFAASQALVPLVRSRPEASGDLVRMGSTEKPVANLVLIDGPEGDLEVRAELTGTFPGYLARMGRGVLFSSLLRPLARAISASPDPVGVFQFLRTSYPALFTMPIVRG
jgi:hypothetical protein